MKVSQLSQIKMKEAVFYLEKRNIYQDIDSTFNVHALGGKDVNLHVKRIEKFNTRDVKLPHSSQEYKDVVQRYFEIVKSKYSEILLFKNEKGREVKIPGVCKENHEALFTQVK